MASFFSSDNWYWKPFSAVADAVVLSSLWTLCAIPIVTAGAATTALYDTVAHTVRGHETDSFRRFFGTFRRELFPSCVSFFLWVLPIWGLYRLIFRFNGTLSPGSGSVMLAAGLMFCLSVLMGIASWVLPLLSRFTFSIGNLQITAAKLACLHPFRTILSGLLTSGAILLCRWSLIGFFLIPELLVLLWTFLMEPVFRSYMPEE